MRKIILVLLFALTSCSGGYTSSSSKQLSSISIVDRNGFSETISVDDRLRQYEQVNYLSSLPYQKVVRVYKRNGRGDIKSIITSYYPNGEVKQYLEVINGRANGPYKEWHPNGTQKLEATLIGGTADIEGGADSGWLFDGMARAWNEEGSLTAEIPYSKGSLDGTAKYYHSNGNIWKTINNSRNKANGKAEIYREDGTLLSSVEYQDDLKHGIAMRYWAKNTVASKELYNQGYLISGIYHDINGSVASEVVDGKGTRALFAKDYILELHEYKEGLPNGDVKVFNPNKQLVRKYHVLEGVKDGEEVIYYENTGNPTPKLSVEWRDDVINGTVKTWYPSGKQESQKEINDNAKNGLSTAWYHDGSVMLIEEYQKDKLQKGLYFKKGDKTPVSKVEKGMGVATIFDSQGNYRSKVIYYNGVPRDDD